MSRCLFVLPHEPGKDAATVQAAREATKERSGASLRAGKQAPAERAQRSLIFSVVWPDAAASTASENPLKQPKMFYLVQL